MITTALPRPARSVPTTLKFFYGSGQAINAIVDGAINTFLLFYLTAVCGMSGSAAGAIFLVSLAIDGVLDPFIGRLSDRWRSRWGRRLPFMVAALPPMMIAALLLFSLPRGLGSALLFGYVLILNLMLRIGLSVFALPHSALNAELTDDYRERSVLSTFRALFLVFGFAAILIPSFSVIFAGDNGLQDHGRYPSLGLLVAGLLAVFGTMCVLGIARGVLTLPRPETSDHDDATGFLAEIAQLFRNPSFVLLFTGAVLALAGQGMASAIGLHALRYFWKLPGNLIQLPLLIQPVGMLLGTVAAGLLLGRIEKRDGVIGALMVIGLYPAVIVALAATGVIVPGSLVATVLVVGNGAIFGAGGAMCFVCFYSMIADAVDEHDLRFGMRREALYAAALMIGSKAATGLGAFVAGVGLQAIGFSAGAGGGTPATLPAATALGMGLLWGPGSAVPCLAAIPFLWRYRLTRARHAAVLAGLSTRRASAVVA